MYAEDIFLEESEVSDTKLCMVSEYSAPCFVENKHRQTDLPWSETASQQGWEVQQSKRPTI